MIKSFRHKGLELFYKTGSKAKINAAHANKLKRQLLALNRASKPKDMDVPGWRLHALQGDLLDFWSITVNGNWRITFTFDSQDVILVDYQDYH